MQRTILGLSLLAALVTISAPAQAGQAVLALSWEPEFCYSHASKPECQLSPVGYYGATNLVLHGLWPNSGSYCGVSSTYITYDTNSQWNLLPAVVLTASSRTLLNQYMPGTLSYLERHEWIKHGTCSGLSQQAYYDVEIRLAQQFGATRFNQLIHNAVGGSVYKTDLLAALDTDFGTDAANAVTLNCTSGYLTEVQFLLDTAVYTQTLTDPLFIYTSNRGSCPSSIKIDKY